MLQARGFISSTPVSHLIYFHCALTDPWRVLGFFDLATMLAHSIDSLVRVSKRVIEGP